MDMFDDLSTERLLDMCGHAYDMACSYYAKHDAAYRNALALLLMVVEELRRRSKNV